MSSILVFYGSYRSDRMGIRLADYLVSGFKDCGEDAELIDAKAVGLPMLDRMYKEYPKGEAPETMETLASKIKAADAFPSPPKPIGAIGEAVLVHGSGEDHLKRDKHHPGKQGRNTETE